MVQTEKPKNLLTLSLMMPDSGENMLESIQQKQVV